MAIVYDDEYVTTAVEIATGQIDATLEGIDQALGKDAVGMHNPSAQQLAAFFFQMQAQYPPQPFAYPGTGMPCPTCHGQQPDANGQTPACLTCAHTGQISHIVTGSPWILSLEFCENGSEWTSRFARFMRTNGTAA